MAKEGKIESTILKKMVNLSKWYLGKDMELKGFGGVMLRILFFFVNILWWIALGVLWVLAIIALIFFEIPTKMRAKQYKQRMKRIDVDIYASHKRPRD